MWMASGGLPAREASGASPAFHRPREVADGSDPPSVAALNVRRRLARKDNTCPSAAPLLFPVRWHSIDGMPDGILRLSILNVYGEFVNEKVDIFLRHQTLADDPSFRGLDASALIDINGLNSTPQGLYRLEVDAPS